MICTKCGSPSVQKASAIVSSGTSYSSGSISGTVASANGPGHFSGTTSSASQTALASQLAPPRAVHGFANSLINVTILSFIVTWPLIIGFRFCGLIFTVILGELIGQGLSLMESFASLNEKISAVWLQLSSAVFIPPAFLPVPLNLIFGLWIAIHNHKYMKTYPERRKLWDRLWYCHKCDARFYDE